jgi:hypothetical protein
MSVMGRFRIRAAAGCAAVAAAFLVAGCGSSSTSTASAGNTAATSTSSTPATGSATRTVDTASVQSSIKKELSVPGAEVTTVKCPANVKAEVGGTFECSVGWSNGATGKVKVTQTTLHAYTSEPVSGSVQIPGATVEKSIQAQLAKQGAPNAQVHCPANIIVKVGSTVTCNVSSASGKANGTVSFAFSTAQGTVEPSSVKTA